MKAKTIASRLFLPLSIRLFLCIKKERRDENVVHGRASFESEMKRAGLPLSITLDPEVSPQLLKKLSFDNWEDMYAAIGYGGLTAVKAVGRIRDDINKALKVQANEKMQAAPLRINPDSEAVRSNRHAVNGVIVEWKQLPSASSLTAQMWLYQIFSKSS